MRQARPGEDGYCRLEADAEGAVLRLLGEWTLAHLPRLERQLAGLDLPGQGDLRVDGAALAALDTAGANHLLRRLHCCGRGALKLSFLGFSPQRQALLRLVSGHAAAQYEPPLRRRGLRRALGWHFFQIGRVVVTALAFTGQTGQALAQLLGKPILFRPREVFVQLEMVGLRAIPIVMLMSYLIGIVFAYLLGIQVQKFGANIFVVDGVGLAITRELAPLLTAVLVAGRSGAAFTAHLGSMKVNQEIDAITILGLSPWQVLVLPRVFAIVLVLPLLTAVADIAGILGAAQVASVQLDITSYTFYERLRETLPLNTVLFGLAKTPVFALAIAMIACHNGFSVSQDARSVGMHTTATVVRSIVAVILIDSAFAVAFPEIEG